MKNKLTTQQNNMLRFSLLIEVMDYHRTTFQYDLVREVKMKFNSFNHHLQGIRNMIQRRMEPEAKEYMEEMGAVIWEAIDELEKAEDKQTLLAVMKAYNEGNVKVEVETNLEEAA